MSSCKAKAAAAADQKQVKLGWASKIAPGAQQPKAPLGKLPAVLPAAPERKAKIQKTSTRNKVNVVSSEEESGKLEVATVVHGMVDQIVLQEEKKESNLLVEVRNSLNTAIDLVCLHWKQDENNIFSALKPKRQCGIGRNALFACGLRCVSTSVWPYLRRVD